jgi:hypothetical protein
MAEREYHIEQTESAAPFGLIAPAFITMGRKYIHECVKVFRAYPCGTRGKSGLIGSALSF